MGGCVGIVSSGSRNKRGWGRHRALAMIIVGVKYTHTHQHTLEHTNARNSTYRVRCLVDRERTRKLDKKRIRNKRETIAECIYHCTSARLRPSLSHSSSAGVERRFFPRDAQRMAQGLVKFLIDRNQLLRRMVVPRPKKKLKNSFWQFLLLFFFYSISVDGHSIYLWNRVKVQKDPHQLNKIKIFSGLAFFKVALSIILIYILESAYQVCLESLFG